MSKEDARNMHKADWISEWCEVLEWYGDGICDDFCPKPDPDCTTCQGGDACKSGCSPPDPDCDVACETSKNLEEQARTYMKNHDLIKAGEERDLSYGQIAWSLTKTAERDMQCLLVMKVQHPIESGGLSKRLMI
jgi:hypothetical protein